MDDDHEHEWLRVDVTRIGSRVYTDYECAICLAECTQAGYL